MRKVVSKYFVFFLIILIIPADGFCLEFRSIDSTGTYYWAEYKIPGKTDSIQTVLYILKLNPRNCDISLLTTKEHQCPPKTAQTWAEEYGYEICINAGMYQKETLLPTGYCRNHDIIINPSFNKYNAFLLFNPLNNRVDPVHIIDRICDNNTENISNYNTVIQSLRMIGCDFENLWNDSDRKHSILALAQDTSSDILILYCREPIVPKEFITHTHNLDLDIRRMIYLEGSTPASLYINTYEFKIDFKGRSNREFPFNMFEQFDYLLPNVIVIRSKR